jgi:16S rRNA (cytosine967-C5)-methyltransferase
MKYFNSYLQTAVTIIQQYQHQTPLALFVKNYFKQHKQIGSKDRKNINQLLYAYYRLGIACGNYSIQQKVAIGLLLIEEEVGYIAIIVPEEYLYLIVQPKNQRQQALQPIVQTIFPFINLLSNGIDTASFINQHLKQPYVFLRVRNGLEKKVIQQLNANNITYSIVEENCIAVAANTKLESVVQLNKEVVVQDYASQQVANLLQQIPNKTNNFQVWDCCAASGGKSILAKDVLGKIQLTVSDNRSSIIANLKQRLFIAGINIQGAYIADATKPISFAPKNGFDLVIADVPCSGSGTWSRTPEYLQHITLPSLQAYSTLQKNIVSNVWQYVKPNGYLLYITCSVYKNENEEVIHYLQQQTTASIIQQQILIGYTVNADTMFACLLQKNSS